jgi:hypothetical protein
MLTVNKNERITLGLEDIQQCLTFKIIEFNNS